MIRGGMRRVGVGVCASATVAPANANRLIRTVPQPVRSKTRSFITCPSRLADRGPPSTPNKAGSMVAITDFHEG